ncbi:MAG: hypothetical protein WBD31_04570 [Rubripirellula sp.]
MSGLKIGNPSQKKIEEIVTRYVSGELTDILLESTEMGEVGMEFLSDPNLGYCAYGVEDSQRGTFGYQTFNGHPSDVLKDISIYQFPESVFLADPELLGDAALEFAKDGSISRRLAWQFRFALAASDAPSSILTADDPRSVDVFLAENASLM